MTNTSDNRQKNRSAAQQNSAQAPRARAAKGIPGKAPTAGAPVGASQGAAGRPSAADPAARATRLGAATTKEGGRSVAIGVGIAVVVIGVVIGLCVWFFAGSGKSIFDSNAQEGQAPYKTQAEIQAELDRIVEEGMFNISIASVIEFEDGTSEGVAYIENVPGNPYNMQVTITDDASGDVLYKSGVIKPNQYIPNIRLEKDLDAGTYPATATFKAYDTDTNEEVGQAAAKITLEVMG